MLMIYSLDPPRRGEGRRTSYLYIARTHKSGNDDSTLIPWRLRCTSQLPANCSFLVPVRMSLWMLLSFAKELADKSPFVACIVWGFTRQKDISSQTSTSLTNLPDTGSSFMFVSRWAEKITPALSQVDVTFGQLAE